MHYTISLLPLLLIALCSCASTTGGSDAGHTGQKTAGVDNHYTLENGTLDLQLRTGDKGDLVPTADEKRDLERKGVSDAPVSRWATRSRYTLRDKATGRVLATAESAYFDGGQIQVAPEIRISKTPDNTYMTILIFENVTSTTPAARYILFTRLKDGKFQTEYLAPPRTPTPKPSTFESSYTAVDPDNENFYSIRRFSSPFTCVY